MAVRVVVVEDSPLQRGILVELLEQTGEIEVVGQAAAVGEAVDLVAALRPDVVTMDLEIPGGPPEMPGGIAAIERIVAARALPILVLSSHASGRNDTLAIDALAAGAADVFPKHPTWEPGAADGLRRRVLVLSRITVVTRRPRGGRPSPGDPSGRHPVVGLAASTGGPAALRTVLSDLGQVPAPVLVVQHIHPEFVRSFARWLQDTTGLPVALAEQGAGLDPGRVLIAPAHTHLRIDARRRVALDPEPDLLSRPSADELLRSLALHAGRSVVAAVLTGMGDDGARGLLAVREAGGMTFAQDGDSAVVDGMPRAARELGAAAREVPLAQMGAAISAAARQVAA